MSHWLIGYRKLVLLVAAYAAVLVSSLNDVIHSVTSAFPREFAPRHFNRFGTDYTVQNLPFRNS